MSHARTLVVRLTSDKLDTLARSPACTIAFVQQPCGRRAAAASRAAASASPLLSSHSESDINGPLVVLPGSLIPAHNWLGYSFGLMNVTKVNYLANTDY